jgi:hypothetical protein
MQTVFDVADNFHQNEHEGDDRSYDYPTPTFRVIGDPGGGANPAESTAK